MIAMHGSDVTTCTASTVGTHGTQAVYGSSWLARAVKGLPVVPAPACRGSYSTLGNEHASYTRPTDIMTCGHSQSCRRPPR